MPGEWFTRLYRAAEARRYAVAGSAVLLTLACAVGLRFARFDDTLDLMVPAGSGAQRMVEVIRRVSFANSVVFSLTRRDQSLSPADLMAAADRLAESLQPPLVTRVTVRFSPAEAAEDLAFFVRHAPEILGDADRAWIAAQIAPEAVDRMLQDRRRQLLRPEGMFLGQSVRADPLGIAGRVLGRVQRLASSFGYRVRVQDEHLVSEDGEHVLLLAQTPVSPTDTRASRRLLEYAGEHVRRLPPGVEANVVCAHTHTVSNEDRIRKDLGIILTLASVAFVLLYVACFRDVGAFLIFLIPAASAVVALGITSVLFDRVSFFTLGFGPVIAGIADDYGIAVYVAVRYGQEAAHAVRRISQAVAVGAVTTMGIFIAFFFSRVPGYHQLAWFSSLSILTSLVFALFVLPHFVRRGARPAPAASAAVGDDPPRRRRDVWTAAGCAVGLAVGAALAPRVHFEDDIAHLDGTGASVRESEARFERVWGGGEKKEALLAVSGTNAAEVLRLSDELYAKAVQAIGEEHVTSVAAVWPAPEQRAANAARWMEFWRNGQAERLRALLAEAAPRQGFTTNAFEPFFAGLHEPRTGAAEEEPRDNALYERIRERFVQRDRQGSLVLAFFADRLDFAQRLEAVATGGVDVCVVSRKALSQTLSDTFSRELIRLSLIALTLILATALAFLRRLRDTAIALVPSVAGVLALLGVLGATGRSLDVANLVSGIVVFGLCIDFGIHILHAWLHRSHRTTRRAVSLAAGTTCVGAGVLLFARHPVLFSAGLTLTVGVGAGYVAAVLVVPALCELFLQKRREEVSP